MRKKKWTGFSSIALKSMPSLRAAERDAQLVHDERAAVRNRDAAADSGRAEILASLEHLEQHAFGLVVELEQSDQLAKDVVLRRPDEVELDRVFAEKLAQFHPLRVERRAVNGREPAKLCEP